MLRRSLFLQLILFSFLAVTATAQADSAAAMAAREAEDRRRLEAEIAAYRKALQENTRARVPLDWGRGPLNQEIARAFEEAWSPRVKDCSMPQTKFWAEMTWTDFEARDMAHAIAVLPLAATEQHGPHLPLGTDSFIMESYIARVVPRVPDELPVLFLPVQNCGLSIEHTDFPGTLSLPAESLIKGWTKLCECVHRAGCRKLVLLTSHGGNTAILDIIAHDLRARLGMLVVLSSWHRFGAPDGLFSADEQAHGIHAGEIETSLMLNFRPDLVRMDEAADFASRSVALEREFNWLRSGRPTGFGWMSQDLSASGAMGNAAAATARKGEACANHGATAFIALLQDIDGFDLTRLTDGPPLP